LIPCIIKIGLIPLLVGMVTLLIGLPRPACLALVLMSGMPSAFANLILAEEYDLDRDLVATAIAMTTSLILVTIPCWLWLFG
ncbi:MAG: AEC family transporter, partial [Cyanobacteria bacterium J06659_2]